MAAVESVFTVQDQFKLPAYALPVMDTHSRQFSKDDHASTINRPSSALARGVQITEFKDNKVNPDPLIAEDTDLLLEDFLSPRKLRDLTGVDNLQDVRYMEMKVDTRDTSLGNFGAHLPNLSQLKLSNSIITTVRDLGSSLNNLRVLWMARCGLEDIDGVSSMNNLKELYLAYNEICDISPCSMLENLKILDLEGNNIDEISQVEYLALCQSLTNLTLEGNPVCVTPSPDQAAADYDYRQAVRDCVPHVKYLDDELLEKRLPEAKQTASVFDDDWKLIEELIDDGTVVGGQEDIVDNIGRPVTAVRPSTGYRPGSALKQQVYGTLGSPSRLMTALTPSTAHRPGSARPGSGRPGSARPGSSRPGSGRSGSARPGTSRPSSQEELDMTEDSSELTLGGVVCGNPSKALRSRQRHLVNEAETVAINKLIAQHAQNPHAKPLPGNLSGNPGDEDGHLHDLFSEVEKWKKEHQIRRKELDAEKAPQILRIDHDDAVTLDSSDEESIDSDREDTPGFSQGHYTYGQSERQPSAQSQLGGSHNITGSIEASGPRTGSAIRSRRYRIAPKQAEECPAPVDGTTVRYSRLQYDDSFEARDDQSPGSLSPEQCHLASVERSRRHSPARSPSPLMPRPLEADCRPNSGPIVASRGKFRLGPMADKNQPKVIDAQHPIVRSSIHSPPDHRLPDGPRAITAQAFALTPTQAPSIRGFRKGQLSGVPLLPSKMANKFK